MTVNLITQYSRASFHSHVTHATYASITIRYHVVYTLHAEGYVGHEVVHIQKG